MSTGVGAVTTGRLFVPRVRRRLAASQFVYGLCWLIVAIAVFFAIFGPYVRPHDPNYSMLQFQYVGPFQAQGYLLGFDSQGRDLLSRLMVGARTSMLGPLLVALMSMGAGAVISVAAAWWGGWVDSVLGTILDILFAFPGILLAVLTAAVFGAGLAAPTIALAIAYTPYIARVLRSAAVRERAREYIAAAEVQGVSAWSICARHLVPNLGRLVVAQATLVFAWAMVDLASISFLGLGVQPPTADWGVMVSTGETGVLQGYPLESLSAGLCIVLVVVAVNLLGERMAERGERKLG
ncbi:MAG TPA: ABC transporter permease [Solirubrobacteraceae bacterium]|nr:ABC transporter permease [Solirubrobacteraceae bacterium]